MKKAVSNLNFIVFLLTALAFVAGVNAQATQTAKADLGSNTAKNGFKNEDEIRDKFNNWRDDKDARDWLALMNYNVADIESVVAAKPHGEKADVEVTITTKKGVTKEGISIKLVSGKTGFNQVDKRWVSHYAKAWRMPSEVEAALKLFVGETPPIKPGRDPKRTYLDELEPAQLKAIIDFFTTNRDEIVSDIFTGDGIHAAGWLMVASKAGVQTRWVIKRDIDAAKFYGEGKIELTSGGNLKIGRISMQRKGGDAGRPTANQLQFKINPVHLFDAK